MRASTELTVTQALEIADMTLETSCRAIQWAINVPELLLASAGAHGTAQQHTSQQPTTAGRHVHASERSAAASRAWQLRVMVSSNACC